jgi:hypothetical protein
VADFLSDPYGAGKSAREARDNRIPKPTVSPLLIPKPKSLGLTIPKPKPTPPVKPPAPKRSSLQEPAPKPPPKKPSKIGGVTPY